MLNEFVFKLPVKSEWIDYNQHMQDAYYGLAFSYAVDHFQNCVGFDERYRTQSGCTIYVVEDHKFYLNEVKLGSELVIKTSLLDTDKKKFVLYSQMFVQDVIVAISEMLQVHVNTKPKPKITEMPIEIYQSFNKLLGQTTKISTFRRSRKLALES
jgi:acyl-CoA thioester hydrolase